MTHTLSVFSLEELALALLLLQADDQAEKLLQSFYGNMSGGQKSLLFVAARHGLISKGFIQDQSADQEVLRPDIGQIIRHLTESRHKLLAIMENEAEQTLFIHASQEQYVYHLSEKNAVHFLGWTTPADWVDQFTAFFRLGNAKSEIAVRHDRSVLLSQALWNRLTDGDWDQSTDIMTWDIATSQKELLAHWYSDYLANDRLLHRISHIVQDSNGHTRTADVMYILPDQAGIWTIRKLSSGADAEHRISIALLTLEEWKREISRFTTLFADSGLS